MLLVPRLTFPDGGAGRALLVLQPDLLEGHQRVCQPTLTLEHCGVRTLQGMEDVNYHVK